MPASARWLLVVALVACAACDKGTSVADVLPPPADWAPIDGPVEIESLGLSFELPPSFETSDDPGLEFLAGNIRHHAVLSVAPDGPDIVDHEPEEGESVSPADIPGVAAVVVTDAVLEGDLAPGLEARELLVANGDRSFSLIMSARESVLPGLWNDFMETVRIEPE